MDSNPGEGANIGFQRKYWNCILNSKLVKGKTYMRIMNRKKSVTYSKCAWKIRWVAGNEQKVERGAFLELACHAKELRLHSAGWGLQTVPR